MDKNRTFIYLLVLFFAVFVGSGLFLIVTSKGKPAPAVNETTTNTLQQQNLVLPTSPPTTGALKLTTEKTPAKYNVMQNVTLTLTADSNAKSIVGYDVVLFYDPLSFDFDSATSLLPDFKVYSYKRGNYLTLTAVKSLSDNSASVFTGSKITTLVFKPKKTGKFNFSLKQSADSEKTDLVTDKTEVLSPALQDLAVEITAIQ